MLHCYYRYENLLAASDTEDDFTMEKIHGERERSNLARGVNTMSNAPCDAGNNPNYSLFKERGTSFLLFSIR